MNPLLELSPTLCNIMQHYATFWASVREFCWSYLPFLTEERDVGYGWIFSAFKTDHISKAKITKDFQGNVVDTMINRRINTIFKEMFLSEFCREFRHNYPSFGRSAVTTLLPLG
jgi:hypothetical protein